MCLEDGGVWRMHTEVPFQQSSGTFSSIPSLNPYSALLPVSPVKHSLSLNRSKSQQQSMGMMLPGAPPALLLSVLPPLMANLETAKQWLCPSQVQLLPEGPAGFSERVSRSVTTLWHLPVQKVALQ